MTASPRKDFPGKYVLNHSIISAVHMGDCSIKLPVKTPTEAFHLFLSNPSCVWVQILVMKKKRRYVINEPETSEVPSWGRFFVFRFQLYHSGHDRHPPFQNQESCRGNKIGGLTMIDKFNFKKEQARFRGFAPFHFLNIFQCPQTLVKQRLTS